MCEVCEYSLVRRAILRGHRRVAIVAEGETVGCSSVIVLVHMHLGILPLFPPGSCTQSSAVQILGKKYDPSIPCCLLSSMVPLEELRNLFHQDATRILAQT